MSAEVSFEPSPWLKELPVYQLATITDLVAQHGDPETAAMKWASAAGAASNAPFGSTTTGPGLFENIKTEFAKLVCGDEAYRELRQQFSDTWDRYKVGVVAAVAGTIGQFIGAAPAVIMPVVALLFTTLAQVGTNAWCSTRNGPPKQDG